METQQLVGINNFHQNIEPLLQERAANLDETERLEKDLEDLLHQTRMVYFKVMNEKFVKEQNFCHYLRKIETTDQYIQLIQAELVARNNIQSDVYLPIFGHTNNRDGGLITIMNSMLVTSPLVQLHEIKNAWDNFIEYTNFKALLTLIGTIITLFIGEFTAQYYGLIIVASIHTFMRLLSNSKREGTDYFTFSRQVQLFLWSFFVLTIGNTLTSFISIKDFPQETLMVGLTYWLIGAELSGIIENAKVLGLPVPPLLVDLAKKIKSFK